MLRPLVRLMMRNGVTFPVLADLLRGLFVEVAAKDLLTDPRARTDSRISLLTGVHRKEIRRLREAPPDSEAVPEVVTLSSQIIARWLGSRDWVDEAGLPKPLPRIGRPDAPQSFDALIASITTDVRPRAVLDDWLSQGIVTLDPDDVVHLETAAFIPRAGGEDQLFYLARNLHDHIAAAAANVSASGAPPFLDRSLHYDRLTPEAAVRLDAFAREAGIRVLLEANRLALDLVEGEAAAPIGPTRRVNFGIYSYIEDEASADPPAPPSSPGAEPEADAES
jgi:hypothetical protein